MEAILSAANWESKDLLRAQPSRASIDYSYLLACNRPGATHRMKMLRVILLMMTTAAAAHAAVTHADWGKLPDGSTIASTLLRPRRWKHAS